MRPARLRRLGLRLSLVAVLALLAPLLLPASASALINEYPLPTANSLPFGITAGPDGALWFVEENGDRVGRITTSGSVSEFQAGLNSNPLGITAGPDGALWFTENFSNQIGRITTSGSLSEFFAGVDRDLRSITAGPDGALWFTELAANKIGRITTSGAISAFTVPTANSNPLGITAGPDGALWFTEPGADKIGRITATCVGSVCGPASFTEFEPPISESHPGEITAGPDGALWFTQSTPAVDLIGRMTTGGSFTEFALPLPESGPAGITAGPDGAVWFTEAGANKIGRLTTSSLSEFPVPTANSSPNKIAAGSDGALWFTEFSGNKIGRIETGAPHNNPPDCSGVTATPNLLSPADRSLRLVSLGGASDPDGDTVSLTITGVTQDEPLMGDGDNTGQDAFSKYFAPDPYAGSILENERNEVYIRAESRKHGDGRVYRIAFTGSDGRGGTCSGTATVAVPSKKGLTVDSAPPSYNSFGL